MKDAEFTVNGFKLKGNLFYPELVKEKNPAIFFIHGWTGEKIRSYQYAKGLAKLGYISLVFDMRGHGESEGNRDIVTPREFLDDVVGVYDFFVHAQGVDQENISVAGASFGSYLSLLLTTKRKVKHLALRVPADYPNNVFEIAKSKNSGSSNADLVVWRSKPKSHNDTFALKAMHDFNGEVLIIESEKDHSVPHGSIQNYINALKDKNKLTHIVVENAPHSTVEGLFRDRVEQILVDWFGKKVKNQTIY